MDLTIVTTVLYTLALDFGSLADAYSIILAYSLTELGELHHKEEPLMCVLVMDILI